MMAAEPEVASRRLAGLLEGHVVVPRDLDVAVMGLASDTRDLGPGQVFFARKGTRVDGARYLEDAACAGAVAVVREGEPGCRRRADGVPEIRVADVAACIGEAADRYFDHPSHGLELVGVTGTNGKSSVSHFIAHALSAREQAGGGVACGVLGTLGYGLYGRLQPSLLTTPDTITLHARLAELRVAGARHAVMEVSSHALDQGRIEALRFAGAVFTNLTRDHLDYHGDMAAYAEAKRKLFEQPGLGFAVVNGDDAFGARLLGALPSRLQRVAYGIAEDIESIGTGHWVRGRIVELNEAGIDLELSTSWGETRLATKLLGRLNAYNVLAALAVLLAMGWSLAAARQALCGLQPIGGRMQRFGAAGEPLVVVDYAHTPDALARALESLREQCRGQLWCVFGAGGDRDRGKRPLMGAAAGEFADHIVLTDDNPRGEDGDAIIDDIRGGISPPKPALIERDRAAAIGYAVARAGPGDIVLVAGKGHETYQESHGERRPFSDSAAVRASLEARGS